MTQKNIKIFINEIDSNHQKCIIPQKKQTFIILMTHGP